jgi:hypothetical protein
MKINELDGGVIYIENAFPLSKEFIEAIEENNENQKINSIIPPWSKWLDGHHVDGVWTPIYERGFVKDINWDYTINGHNIIWPRIEVDPKYSKEHSEAYTILKMIDEPYKKALNVWSEKTGNPKVNLITKNYTIKKYNTSQMIPAHSDRDHDHDFNTFDWTALIYLNDDYTGGELEFNNLGYSIEPTAGSIVFFLSDEVHTAHQVISGNKYFIFLYIHSDIGYTHSINERFFETANNIRNKTI